MPRVREDGYGTGDQTWLGSTHGIYNCRTGTLTTEAFTPNEDGVIPSGTPVDASDEAAMVPYSGGGALGFLYTDQSVEFADDTIAAPILRHGTINVAHLPVEFSAPADGGAFVFVGAGSSGGGAPEPEPEPAGNDTGGEVA